MCCCNGLYCKFYSRMEKINTTSFNKPSYTQLQKSYSFSLHFICIWIELESTSWVRFMSDTNEFALECSKNSIWVSWVTQANMQITFTTFPPSSNRSPVLCITTSIDVGLSQFQADTTFTISILNVWWRYKIFRWGRGKCPYHFALFNLLLVPCMNSFGLSHVRVGIYTNSIKPSEQIHIITYNVKGGGHRTLDSFHFYLKRTLSSLSES